MVLYAVSCYLCALYAPLRYDRAHWGNIRFGAMIALMACIIQVCKIATCSTGACYNPRRRSPTVYKVQQFNSRNGRSVTGVVSQANSCTHAHLDLFQLAFTWAIYEMSHSFPSSRGSGTCPWYNAGGKMSGKNLEQWINAPCNFWLFQN
jgi:hypothetical protein